MKKSTTLGKHFLYSTNTWLANKISERFYSDLHYVWCTPFFDGDNIASNQFTVPPSSTPQDICQRLSNDIRRGDNHSSKIIQNKDGIKRGAEFKCKNGIITEGEKNAIIQIVDNSRLLDFKPLIYVIPYEKVESQLESVKIADRAHPLSDEFIIRELKREDFDIISFPIMSL